MDMHSGGSVKVFHPEYDTDVEYIYIEASSREEAVQTFRKTFKRDPVDSACDCCGADYSISREESLEEATSYERGWETSLEAFMQESHVIFILKNST